MEDRVLRHLFPTLDMLAQELNLAGFACRVVRDGGDRRFRGARRFTARSTPAEDVIWVVDDRDAGIFKGSALPCVCTTQVAGRGGCILSMHQTAEALLEALLEIFERCRDMEARIDDLVYRNGDPRQLCELGAELLENPICIHDDWFVMVARSSELAEVMPPDYVMSSSKEFIPRVVVDDFKNDGGYLETYVYRDARMWNPGPQGPKCIYANLWEGSVYCGRLLVVEHRRAFHRLDYALAELLAQRALMLLNHSRSGAERTFRSMDDIVLDLLNGKDPEPREKEQFLAMLGWKREERLLCVRLELQQQPGSAVLDHTLHSDLFQVFPQGYILFSGHQQCVLLNLDQQALTLPLLRHRLAPLCRDYCLYAGISSPVTGIGELRVAYTQARVALEKVFQLRDERWLMTFSECSLEYMLGQVRASMELKHLVAPELYTLIEHDRQRGTQYYQTLRAFLLNERDIPRTSEALIIHRTTLLYRLRKLQSIAAMDLDDPAKRLQLLVSLWILEKLN